MPYLVVENATSFVSLSFLCAVQLFPAYSALIELVLKRSFHAWLSGKSNSFATETKVTNLTLTVLIVSKEESKRS